MYKALTPYISNPCRSGLGREPPIAVHNLYVCLLEGGIEIQILLNNSSQLRIKTTKRTIGSRSRTAGFGQNRAFDGSYGRVRFKRIADLDWGSNSLARIELRQKVREVADLFDVVLQPRLSLGVGETVSNQGSANGFQD